MKSKLLRNGIYNAIGGALKIGIGIITIPIIISSLGTEEYGLWSLTFSIVSVVSLAEAGFSTATTVFAAEDLKKKDAHGLAYTLTATSLAILVLATSASIFLLTQSDYIVNNFVSLSSQDKIRTISSLQIGSIVVWTKLIQQVLIGIQQAYELYGIINLVNTSVSILTGLAMMLISANHGLVKELMIGQSIVSSLSLILHLYSVAVLFKREKISFRLRFDLDKSIRIIKYSFMMWLTTLGSVLFSRVDRLIVGNILGIQTLGVYAAITDITSQINVFSALAVQPIISSVTESKISDQREIVNIRKQVSKSLLVNTVIALFIGEFLICGTPFILQKILNISVLHKSYIVSFKTAALIYSLYSINAVGFYILLGSNKTLISSLISLTVGLFSLILIFIGCQIGLIGAIIGNAGFLGVYGFTFFGMQIVGIKLSKWTKHIYKLVILFIAISMLSIYEVVSQEVTILLYLLYTALSMRYTISEFHVIRTS